MTIWNVLRLLGGVGLFIYGMMSMGSGLEKLASGKTESILARLTSSLPRGVLLGTVLTGIIQSSSATTVIVIALVNSGVMKFSQAVGVVMGANIGTTITSQIIRLSDLTSTSFALQMFKPSTLAPVAIVIGVFLTLFVKSSKKRDIGYILLGFGVLFTGMLMMEDAVVPLRGNPLFERLFTTLSNPLFGILAGCGVTAVIQSSSASVGILQALTTTGLVTWSSAVPIILGQNIGTCVTGLIASTGASRAAKRVAFCHLYYNVIGTLLAVAVVYAVRAFGALPFWNDVIGMGDIANFHLLFNVCTTLFFIPFSRMLIKLSELTVPEKAGYANTPEVEPIALDTRLYAAPALALAQARKSVEQMLDIIRLMCADVLPLMLHYDEEVAALNMARENRLDAREVSITDYLVGLARLELNEDDAREATTLLLLVSVVERIGDYVTKIVVSAKGMNSKKIAFSDMAVRELGILNSAVCEVLNRTREAFIHCDMQMLRHVEPLEETVDDICETLHARHVERLKQGSCTIDAGVIFLEAIACYGRISDHCSNVAARLISNIGDNHTDPHTLLRRLHEGQEQYYNVLIGEYREKYKLPAASM